MPCTLAVDKETIQPGHVYIAPPDAHLLVKDGKIVIGHGPAENRFRPSIDVLFRSAAAGYGERAVGIILTGMLNDGTAGMWAIQQSGGHCIVQNPNEAEYPDMPLSVLEIVQVDHCISLKKMGDIVNIICRNNGSKKIKPPAIITLESALSEKAATNLEKVATLGEKSTYSCPDCGGGLWKIGNDKASHYRCHIGHAYSEKDLLVRQSETIEQTIWVAVRMMEERKFLLLRMAGENDKKGLGKLGMHYRKQAEELDNHLEKMKGLLFLINKD
jgi:two-component system chemotaxis response regulator CheB